MRISCVASPPMFQRGILEVSRGSGDEGRLDVMPRQASTGTVYLWRFTSPSTIEGLEIGPVGAEWTMVNP